MGKWLAAGGVVLLALVILLWYEMQSSGAIAAPTTNTKPVAQAEAEPQHPAPVAHAIAAAAVTTEQPGKIDPASDAFFNQFTDKLPSIVSGNALRKCYSSPGLHRRDRDAFLTLEFVDTIKNGEVTISNVRVKKSSLSDPALESCMIAEVARSHWHDDSLPDTSQPDEVTINPERIVKKYVDDGYEGPLAPPNTPR